MFARRGTPGGRWRWLRAGAVLGALGASAWLVGAATPSGQAAAAPVAWPAGLEIGDEALFANTVDPRLTVRLLDSQFVGVALRAPSRIEMDRRSSLPVWVASRFDGARGWAWPFDENAWLLAIGAGSGELRLQPAFGSTKRAAPTGPLPKPAADELRQFGAQITPVDARARLGLPWQPGCWTLQMIYRDWRSNAVGVALERAGAAPAADAAAQRCGAPRPANPLDFKLVRPAGGEPRLGGRFSLAPQASGLKATTVAATLLVFPARGAPPRRLDWQVPLAPAQGARPPSGELDRPLPAEMLPQPGDIAYLLLAGQLHGPKAWAPR